MNERRGLRLFRFILSASSKDTASHINTRISEGLPELQVVDPLEDPARFFCRLKALLIY